MSKKWKRCPCCGGKPRLCFTQGDGDCCLFAQLTVGCDNGCVLMRVIGKLEYGTKQNPGKTWYKIEKKARRQ